MSKMEKIIEDSERREYTMLSETNCTYLNVVSKFLFSFREIINLIREVGLENCGITEKQSYYPHILFDGNIKNYDKIKNGLMFKENDEVVVICTTKNNITMQIVANMRTGFPNRFLVENSHNTGKTLEELLEKNANLEKEITESFEELKQKFFNKVIGINGEDCIQQIIDAKKEENLFEKFASILEKIPNIGDKHEFLGYMTHEYDEFFKAVGCKIERYDFGVETSAIVRVKEMNSSEETQNPKGKPKVRKDETIFPKANNI